MDRESLLMATFVEIADNLVEGYDVIDVLSVLCDRCVQTIDVDAAGVLLSSPDGQLQYVASSSETMRVLELFQIQVDEGPSMDCYRNGLAIVNLSLSESAGRWPLFSPRALAEGFHSVCCVPMRLRGRTIGALNLFRSNQTWLDDADLAMVQALADVATIAILQHQSTLNANTLNAQLNNALSSRIIIEQAKGMICEATNCDMVSAFHRLRAHARNHNVGLTELATRIVTRTTKSRDLDEWVKPTKS